MILSLERPIHTIQHTSGGKPLLTILAQKIEINQHGVVPKIVSRTTQYQLYFSATKINTVPLPINLFCCFVVNFSYIFLLHLSGLLCHVWIGASKYVMQTGANDDTCMQEEEWTTSDEITVSHFVAFVTIAITILWLQCHLNYTELYSQWVPSLQEALI